MTYQELYTMSTTPPPLPNTDVVSQLLPALITCFGTILLGYFAARFRILTAQQAKGLNAYVTNFALPAVFFKVMVSINFAGVSWYLVLAVSLSKAIAFFAAFMLAMVISRKHNFGIAAITAMFVSQSNDVALGYPVLKALFPDLASYIYLFAPAQLVILNPMAYFALEWHSAGSQGQVTPSPSTAAGDGQSGLRMRLRRFLQVLGRVLLNPIFFMTVIGVVFNFILKHKIPTYLEGLFTIVADSFAAAALFTLGFGMVGITRGISKQEVYTLVAILTCKLVLLPFVTRELVSQMLIVGGTEANSTLRYSTFAFLYGAIPTAPPVYLFAAEYQVMANVVGAGLVVGTFLCAPMMFLLARMITLFMANPSEYDALLDSTVADISWASIVCGIWTIFFLFLSRKAFHVPHRFTVCYILCVILSCVGVVTGCFLESHSLSVKVSLAPGREFETMTVAEQSAGRSPANWVHYLQFTFFFIGCIGARCWTSLIALSLLMERARSLCFLLRHQIYMYLAGFVFPVLVTSLLLLTTDRQTVQDIHPVFQYGMNQMIVSLVVLSVNMLVTLSCLIYYIRLGSTQASLYEVLPSPLPSRDQGHFNLGQDARTATSSTSADGEVSSSPFQSRRQSNPGPDWMRHFQTRCFCSDLAQRRHCHRLLTNYDRLCSSSLTGHCHPTSPPLLPRGASPQQQQGDSGETPIETGCSFLCLGEYQHQYHVTLLLFLLVTMFFGICLCTWRLVNEAPSGVYVVLEFLDGVFNFGQGLVVFVILGLDVDLIIFPIRRLLNINLRRLFGSLLEGTISETAAATSTDGVNTLEESQRQAAEKVGRQFMQFHLDSCRRQITQCMTVNGLAMDSVTSEAALLHWLVDSGLAGGSVAEAKSYLVALEACHLVREVPALLVDGGVALPSPLDLRLRSVSGQRSVEGDRSERLLQLVEGGNTKL